MSSSELPLWQRIILAAMLIAAAWFFKEADFLANAGASAVQLVAGLAAVSMCLGGDVPLGLWPARFKRDSFAWGSALLLAIVGALVVAFFGRGGLVAGEWAQDKGGIVALVFGGAVWSAALGASKMPPHRRWLAIAAIGGILPGIGGILWVRSVDWMALSVDGYTLVASVGFFLVAKTALVLVADELAFRRVLVGRTGGAGLLMVLVGAFVYGIWATFLPEAGPNLLAVFLSGFARGVAAGSLYVLSRSLLISSVFTGFSLAVTSGSVRALRLGGTGDGYIIQFWNGTMVLTLLIAAVLAWVLYRTKGLGGFGEYQVSADASDS